jgi:cytochrome c oxidase subunit IV
VTAVKPTLKKKAVHEVREYLLISLYLFVVFSLLVVHRSMILAEYHINYTLHGFALINALALAKVMLIAQDMHLADQFRDAPLIYPTLLKSLVFTVLLACFKIAEDAFVGSLHGKTFHQSLSDLGDGSWSGILILTALLFVMLIPFFGFRELRRVFGAERLIAVFFRPRHLWNLPPTASPG